MKKLDLLDKLKGLSGLNQEEKAYLINLINTKKKFGLVWEDKPENVEEELREKLPILQEVGDRAVLAKQPSEKCPNHILIEGDNLHALTTLTFTHEGKIDAIYIDPPYNTGAKDWKYNNNYVDSADPYRHSKWLAMMEKRLRIAKRLLSEDGIICVTIDDYEAHRLWCLMDEIFNENNHLGTIAIRINPGGRKAKRKVALQHEYAIFYSRSFETKVTQIIKAPEDKSHTYQQDENGEWYEERNLRKEGADSLATKKNGELSDRYYPIYYNPSTKEVSSIQKFEIEIWPIDTKGKKRIWRRGKDAIDDMFSSNDVFYKETKFGPQIYFRFKGGVSGEPPKSFWEEKKYSASEHGTRILDTIMDARETFPFPKSPYAVEDCIKVATGKKNATILDFFAGSGTTLQAVINMNNEDKGSRQCILVTNNENNICEEITYVRSSRVITGYKDAIEPSPDNNLRYYQTKFLNRTPSLKNKKELTHLSTELLCIKENCYNECSSLLDRTGNWISLFTDTKGRFLCVIYDDAQIEDAITLLMKFIGQHSPKDKIRVYVFANGQYPYTEEFEDILDHVTLCALPDAIYKAYQNVLPKKQREFIPELEEPTAEETERSTEETVEEILASKNSSSK